MKGLMNWLKNALEYCCEPIPITPLERWLLNRPTPRVEVSPVVPFGGF